MKTARFALAWLFIFAAAFYDGWFAWHYRAEFFDWEQNPIASWGVQHFGLSGIFLFKVIGLVFAISVAVYCHRRSLLAGRFLTGTLTCAYLMLSMHYYAGHQYTQDRVASLHQASLRQR